MLHIDPGEEQVAEAVAETSRNPPPENDYWDTSCNFWLYELLLQHEELIQEVNARYLVGRSPDNWILVGEFESVGDIDEESLISMQDEDGKFGVLAAYRIGGINVLTTPFDQRSFPENRPRMGMAVMHNDLVILSRRESSRSASVGIPFALARVQLVGERNPEDAYPYWMTDQPGYDSRQLQLVDIETGTILVDDLLGELNKGMGWMIMPILQIQKLENNPDQVRTRLFEKDRDLAAGEVTRAVYERRLFPDREMEITSRIIQSLIARIDGLGEAGQFLLLEGYKMGRTSKRSHKYDLLTHVLDSYLRNDPYKDMIPYLYSGLLLGVIFKYNSGRELGVKEQMAARRETREIVNHMREIGAFACHHEDLFSLWKLVTRALEIEMRQAERRVDPQNPGSEYEPEIIEDILDRAIDVSMFLSGSFT